MSPVKQNPIKLLFFLYERVLMRNPFDENDTATKQELSNYAFYGRKSKYDDIQFTHQQIFLHLLKNHIENMLNSADSLKRQCRDLHSLLDVLYRKFMVVQCAVFGYDAVLTLRLGGKRIARYALSLLDILRMQIYSQNIQNIQDFTDLASFFCF